MGKNLPAPEPLDIAAERMRLVIEKAEQGSLGAVPVWRVADGRSEAGRHAVSAADWPDGGIFLQLKDV